MCDDPDCTHGAVKRGWDAVGRFFGAWGHSEKSTTATQNRVVAGPAQQQKIDDFLEQMRDDNEQLQGGITLSDITVEYDSQLEAIAGSLEFALPSASFEGLFKYLMPAEDIITNVFKGSLNVTKPHIIINPRP